MEHPKAVGERTTLAVMAALREAGFDLYVPFGENTRVDLIIDDGNRLARVRKTGRLRLGAVRFNTCSIYAHHPNRKVVRRDYLGQIDYWGVHCPETCGVYLVPIADAPVRKQAALRVDPSRNNQRRFVRLAADYQT
ncbi:MAG: group I intron-associated PD-(D/E)XK endonuclease, partial [Vicinamibacterales bacterium]